MLCTLPASLKFRTEDYVTGKGQVHPRMVIKAHGGGEGSNGMSTLSLTSALNWVGGQRHALPLYPGERDPKPIV